ncbi:MAG: glycoside hydrolase family 3 C-terminal domain-containing protein, partial [Prevotella sp.]|nr:glycoside hydrolase family 3 C-terminal domain-containing protein [Prevotella sp.]
LQLDYMQDTDMGALQFDVVKRMKPTKQQLLEQAEGFSTVVFVGGISPRLEGEEMKVDAPGFKGGDRTDIQLPQVQRDVLKALHDAGKKVIFINCSGSAIALTPELETTDAILQAWYPGEEGGNAVADVLFGDHNPEGKLPITFYKSVNDLPDFLDYRMDNRTYRYFTGEALFPFGHGLSYTSFNFSKPSFKKGKVMVSVSNTGKVRGTETVQVYVKRIDDKGKLIKTLRGYKKVALNPGETKVVEIDMPRERFEFWDDNTNTMRIIPGKYQLMVGNSSDANALKTIVVKVK